MVPWQPEDDIKIVEAHASVGPRWSLIAARLPGRSVASVRNRFLRIESAAKIRATGQITKNRCQLCGKPKRGHICEQKMHLVVTPTRRSNSSTIPTPMESQGLKKTSSITGSVAVPSQLASSELAVLSHTALAVHQVGTDHQPPSQQFCFPVLGGSSPSDSVASIDGIDETEETRESLNTERVMAQVEDDVYSQRAPGLSHEEVSPREPSQAPSSAICEQTFPFVGVKELFTNMEPLSLLVTVSVQSPRAVVAPAAA